MTENGEDTQAVQDPENDNQEELKNSGAAEDDVETQATAMASGEENSKKRRKTEGKEPVTPLLDRPSRERKSIARFIDSVEREKEKPKEFKIEQGSGAFLRDIPNVAFKFSKRKWSDETVQLLHKLLYNRRAKPQQVKTHILQFSGWAWGANEEKEKSKLKEKLEKCLKESLWQVCDLFDLNLPKTTRKEEMILKVFEFLDCPNKTSETLLEEQEQKAKKEKRQKPTAKGKRRKSSGKAPSKEQKHGGKSSNGGLEEEEEEEEEEERAAAAAGGGGGGGGGGEAEEEPEKEPVEVQPGKKVLAKKPRSTKKGGRRTAKKSSDTEVLEEVEQDKEPKEADNNSKEDDDDEEPKRKRSKKKKIEDEISPKRSAHKPAKKKSVNALPQEEEEATEHPKDTQSKPLNKGFKSQVPIEAKASHVKKKKKEELEGDAPQEILKKAREKRKEPIKEESKPIPTDDDLSAAICELLGEADFSMVTFTDVIKQLEAKYGVDLSQRKAHVKVLIQEEISKLVDEDEGEGSGEDKVDPEPVATAAQD